MHSLKIVLISAMNFFCISFAFADCDSDMPRNKPDAIYKDYGDGTVMDTKTRLIWQKCSMGQTYSSGTCVGTATSYTWDQAMAAAQAANIADMYGHNDWRVPNVKELFSLIDMACYRPSINEVFFPSVIPDDLYWSSMPSFQNSQRAYFIFMDTGGYSYTSKSNDFLKLRLVR